MKTLRSIDVVSVVAAIVGLLALGILASPVLHGQEPQSDQAVENVPARAVLDVPAVFDVGTVPHVGITKYKLKFSNTGNADLIIDRVGTSCGCTFPSIEDDQRLIPPGGTGVINVDINPAKMSNFDFDNVVVIFSNDYEKDPFTVHVIGTVEPEFEVVPAAADFGTIRKGEKKVIEMVWRQLVDDPIEITGLEPALTGTEVFDLSFEKRAESEWAKPGHTEYTLKVSYNDQLVSPGPFKETLQSFVIFTNHKRMHRFNVFVSGFFDSFYHVEPRRPLTVNTSRVLPPEEEVPNYANSTAHIVADRPFELVDISSPSGRLLPITSPGPVENSIRIDVHVAPDTDPIQWQDYIYFTLKSGDEIVHDSLSVHLVVQGPRVARPENEQQKEITRQRLERLHEMLRQQDAERKSRQPAEVQ